MYLVYLRKHILIFYVRNIPEYGLKKPYYYKKKKKNSCLMKLCMPVYGIGLFQKNLSMVGTKQ